MTGAHFRSLCRSFRCFLFLVCLFLGAWNFADAHSPFWEEPDAKYVRRVWNASDGLHSTLVRAMAQSRDGYLWLATEEGLTRFDGVRFTDFDVRNVSETHSRWVIDVLERSDGSIWVSSSNGGVTRLKDGGLTRYTKEQGLNDNFVLALHEDQDGRLWLGTAVGLMHFADGEFYDYRAESGWKPRAVRAFAEDGSGALWLGTSMGLVRMADGQFETFSRENGEIVHDSVMALHMDRDRNLWVGTSAGLTIRGADGSSRHFTVADGLAHESIRAIYQDREGTIWIGSHGGLQQFSGDGFQTVNVRDRGSELSDGRIPDLVYGILEDREGGLWAGTSLGLSQLNRQKFYTLGQEEGLPIDVATSVLEGRDGYVWVATWGGGLSRVNSGEIRTWKASDGLASDYVLALEQAADGAIWIGTDGFGINRYAEGQFSHYRLDGGRAENTVRVLFEDSRGRLWAGGNAGLSLFEDGKFRSAPDFPGLALTTVATIVEDAAGALWVGSSEGLTRFDDDGFQTFSTADGLPSSIVIMIYPDPDGSFWVATEGGGLSRLNPHDGSVFVFSGESGLFRERILHMLADDEGFFWFNTRNGIYRVEREELIAFAEGESAFLSPVSYGKADGLRREQGNGIAQPSGIKSRDGRLWFVTLGGVVNFDPASIKTNAIPTPAIIEQVQIDGKTFALGDDLRVPPGRGKLEVKFTAPSLQVPEKVRFRYRLEGFESEWQEAGSDRTAVYTNLPPQAYRFQVTASNNDGVWSESPAEFSFRLKPRFYQTVWFYTLCALGLIGIGAAAYRLRVERIRRRHDQLAILVDARTRELQEEIRERRAAERRTAVFSRLGQQLSLAPTQKEAAETILTMADELIAWDSCGLHTYSEETGKRHPVIIYDVIDGKRVPIEPTSVQCGVNPWRKVLEEGPQLILRDELAFADEIQPFGDVSRPSASLMFAAMRKGDRVVGLILMHSYRFNAFDQQDLETLQALADYCGGAFERIRAEEALRESQELILHQERLAAIGQLSSGTAHEFNNILTIIKGHSSLLLNEEGLTPQMAVSIREIAGSAERAANLTRQLLTFSRKQYMRPETLDLNALIEQVVNMLRQVLGERLVVECHFEKDLAPVRADLAMMEQVVMNLAVNARDAVAETGGKLSISTANALLADAHRHPEARAGKFVRLIVSDTGHGMDPATMRQIFEPFFTTKGVGEGTGLGLASVYGIVKQHRGWIEVKSAPGKGSDFCIFLPATEITATVEAPSIPLPSTAVSGGHERILLVEDEPGLRQMAMMFLTAMRYNVFEAGTGTEALEVWEQQSGQIDLLFTDMVLPSGMSGRELAGQLRTLKPDLPVILTSGYSREIIGGNLADDDSITFVPKPYSPLEIGEIIQNLLGKAEMLKG